MKIREAKLKDISKIEEIREKAVADEGKLQFKGKKLKEFLEDEKKHKKKRLEEFKKDIRSSLMHVVVVEKKDEIIGFGIANVNKENKKFGETNMVYVKKKFRRKGIASKIKKELLKWLKNKKVKYAFASMYSKNKPAINLNKKFGFDIVSVGMHKELK